MPSGDPLYGCPAYLILGTNLPELTENQCRSPKTIVAVPSSPIDRERGKVSQAMFLVVNKP